MKDILTQYCTAVRIYSKWSTLKYFPISENVLNIEFSILKISTWNCVSSLVSMHCSAFLSTGPVNLVKVRAQAQ